MNLVAFGDFSGVKNFHFWSLKAQEKKRWLKSEEKKKDPINNGKFHTQ